MDRRPFLLCISLSLGAHLALFTLFWPRAGEMKGEKMIPVALYLRSGGEPAPSSAASPPATRSAPSPAPLSREKTDSSAFRRPSGAPAKSSPAAPQPPPAAASLAADIPPPAGSTGSGEAATSSGEPSREREESPGSLPVPAGGGPPSGASSVAGTGASLPAEVVRAEPDYAENPPPLYPRPALSRGWEGTVWLQVRVTAGGQVAELKLERTSGHSVLDRAALDAVRTWRFRPARVGGRAVEGVVLVPVEFRIRRS